MARVLTSLLLPSLLFAGAGSATAQGPARPGDGSRHGAATMVITRKADRTTIAGPAEWFTGTVTITGQFQRSAPSRVGGAIVHFEPGARTAWHTHPLGQTLIVTEGVGWTQVEGGDVVEFHAGDQLWCPADRKHWHGATPTSAMTHIAIQESQDGSPVTWLEHVTDADYRAVPAQR